MHSHLWLHLLSHKVQEQLHNRSSISCEDFHLPTVIRYYHWMQLQRSLHLFLVWFIFRTNLSINQGWIFYTPLISPWMQGKGGMQIWWVTWEFKIRAHAIHVCLLVFLWLSSTCSSFYHKMNCCSIHSVLWWPHGFSKRSCIHLDYSGIWLYLSVWHSEEGGSAWGELVAWQGRGLSRIFPNWGIA